MVYDLKPEDDDARPTPAARWLDERRVRATQEIREDLGCANCGYNLRGLPRNHRCPECGTSVQRSMGSNLIRNASPDWLKKISLGLALMMGSVATDIAGAINLCVTPALGYFLNWVAAGLAVAGLIYLTTPEPREAFEVPGFNLRKILRQISIGRFVCNLVLLAGSIGLPSWMMGIVALLGGLASIAIVLGVSWYLMQMAKRMDDYDLEVRTQYCMWGFAASLAGTTVFGLAGWALAGVNATAGIGAGAACLSYVAILALLGFGIYYWILIYRYYQTIRWAVSEMESEIEDGKA